VPNAVADSFIFVTLAFGFLPGIILAQIAAKVVGGALWSLLIRSKRTLAVASFLLLLVIPVHAQPKPMVLIGSHYDLARQAPIASVVYQVPVADRVFVNGFAEAWQNNDRAYPAGEPSIFSKHWISYSLTPRLSLSTEVEWIWNRAGVDFLWPREMQFQPGNRRVYVTPKIGATYRVL
jgi:hypothetical protein